MIAISMIQHAIQRAPQSLRRFTSRSQTSPSTYSSYRTCERTNAQSCSSPVFLPCALLCDFVIPRRRHGRLYSRSWSPDMLHRSSPYHMRLGAIHTSGGDPSSRPARIPQARPIRRWLLEPGPLLLLCLRRIRACSSLPLRLIRHGYGPR